MRSGRLGRADPIPAEQAVNTLIAELAIRTAGESSGPRSAAAGLRLLL
jgi:hypothetical protein